MNPVDCVRQALAAVGLDPDLIRELPADTSTAETAALAVGAPLGSIVKSLIFLLDGAPLLVLVSGDQRADVKQLRAVLGLSKRRLRIAQPAEVVEHTGFEVGGVPPLGHTPPLRTLIDRTLSRFTTVWAAAGSAHAVFPIAYGQLVAITRGEVMDLVVPEENAGLPDNAPAVEQTNLEFVEFVAHALKQPMTSIQGYAKMMLLGIGGELNDTNKQFAQVINSSAERLGKMVNGLLDISRLEAGRVELDLGPVLLGEVVDEAITRTRTEIETRHQTVDVDISEGLPPAMGDRERLIQVVTHLLNNACAYTPEGGAIRIAAERHDRPGASSGYLLVSVGDTGIGISSGDLARLGEKFFRGDHDLVRAQRGLGVGVPIVRHLVALHGGELLVESEPEKGSTFRFTVPIADT